MGIPEARYLLAFIISLTVSLVVTPFVIRLAMRLGVVDHPDGSRWNNRAVPRAGGIAMFLGFLVASVILAPIDRGVLLVLAGAAGIFLLGFLDDRFGTFPKAKFVTQIGIALALVLYGVRINILSVAIAIPLTLIWIVGISNAFNLIDNMDGLSSGIAFIAAMTLFLLSRGSGQLAVPVMSLALAGACLGFLRYNFNPARVFMGDCGSLLLGFVLSVLAILGFWQEASPVFPVLAAPVLVLGYAVFDTTFVTVLRLKNGGRPWVGGKDHSSHRLVKMGLSEKVAVLLLYALGVVGGISASMVLRVNLMMGVSMVVSLLIIAVAFGWVLARRTRSVMSNE